MAFQVYCQAISDVLEERKNTADGGDPSGATYYWFSGEYPRVTHTLNAVLDSWRIVWENSNLKGGKDHAERRPSPSEVLDLIMSEYDTIADSRSFVMLMTAAKRGGLGLAKVHDKRQSGARESYSGGIDAANFCEHVLDVMLSPPSSGPSLAKTTEESRFLQRRLPDSVAFATAIDAWSKSKSSCAADRAMTLFQLQNQLHAQGLVDAQPSTESYNTVLNALTRKVSSVRKRKRTSYGSPDGISSHMQQMQRADNMVQEMMDSPYKNVWPDTVTFRILINGWAIAGDALKAARWLLEAVRLYKPSSSFEGEFEDGICVRPRVKVDATMFSQVISVLAKQYEFEKAEELYRSLLYLYNDTKDPQLEPEFRVLRSMLIVYAKTDRPGDAEALLQKLEKHAASAPSRELRLKLWPKRGHYRDVLLGWVNSSGKDSDKVERAERILRRMIEALVRQKKEFSETRGETNSARSHFRSDNYQTPVADKHAIDIVLKLWSQSGRRDAPERAEALLREVEKYSRDGHLNPIGRSSILRVMKCWSLSGKPEAGHRAEALLKKLKDNPGKADIATRPTRAHYTVAIKAWVRSGHADSMHFAQELFNKAIEDYEKGGNNEARPDNLLYSNLMSGYAKYGDGFGAARVLELMLGDRDEGNPLLRISIEEFNLVLLAWWRSKSQYASDQALAFLRLMREREIKPNVRTYDILIGILKDAEHTPRLEPGPPDLLASFKRERAALKS